MNTIKILGISFLMVIIFSGCVSKMVGGAVDIVTFGIVKDDTQRKYQHNFVDKEQLKQS